MKVIVEPAGNRTARATSIEVVAPADLSPFIHLYTPAIKPAPIMIVMWGNAAASLI